jgi:hypothetical protein
MEVEIKDDYLPLEYFEYLKREVSSSYFPWFFNDFVNYENNEELLAAENAQYPLAPKSLGHQLTHSFVLQGEAKSEYLGILKGLLSQMGVLRVIRAKVNSTRQGDHSFRTGFHRDWEGESGVKVGVLYLNSCNGGTLLDDGTFIESVENRLVIFDSNTKHSGVLHSDDTPRRLVLNLNFV